MKAWRWSSLGALALVACVPAPSAVMAANSGNVSGLVYGQGGKAQPLPGAVVRIGDRRTDAGNPPTSLEGLPASDQVTDDGVRYVAHRFDLNGDDQPDTDPMPAERRLRAYPPVAGVGPEHLRRFAYLRAGEFFLEAVPEGSATVTAEFGGATAEQRVEVRAKTTVVDVGLQLMLPLPIVTENGAAVRVVTWSGLSPATGLVVRADLGASSLNFEPSPPDVTVRLKAPPGSQGSSVKAVQVAYVYQTPANEAAKKAPLVMGPIRFELPLRQVAAATHFGFGAELSVPVAVGSAQLLPIFLAAKAEDRPSVVNAELSFEDEAGFTLQDANFSNLKVVVPIRRL